MAAITLFVPDPASVKLVGCSPPSWMVQLALEEKGIAHTLVKLDFQKGEHRQGRVAALNPRCTVPVLEHGDAVFTEAFAMLQWIERCHPEPAWMPSHRPASALALERFHAASAWKRAGMDLLGAVMRSSPGDRDTARFAAPLGRVHDQLGAVERWYAPGPHAIGDAISLVDLAVMTYVAPLVQLGLVLDPRYPAVASAFDRWKRRDAVRATWPSTWASAPDDLLGGASE